MNKLTTSNMSKKFEESFRELQKFVEQNKRMPRPQCRSNREEMLLGLWVFRTLQHCTVEEENKIRLLAKGVPGPCPKPYADRVRELNKFITENRRLPERSRGDVEKSLYDFIKKNIDKPEMKRLHAKFGKGV